MVRDVDLNAEVAVLGSLLIDPSVAGDVFSRLNPDDFSDSTFRNIFTAARKIHLDGRPLDPVVVLEAAGGAYERVMADVIRVTPTAANCSLYVDVLLNASRVRRLNQIGAQLINVTSYDEGLALLSKAEGLLSLRPQRRASTYTEMIHEYLDRQNSDEPLNHIDWGIPALNRIKVTPGRYVILGADSSVGKTALALQLAINVAKAGKKVGFFSYETDRQDAIDRILANTASVNMERSLNKSLTAHDFAMVNSEGFSSERVPLTVIESAEYTVDELRAEILSQRYDVIFIDYLQLIPASGSAARWQDVSGVSMALHSMAQRLGVTVVALSQVTLPEKNKNGVRPHVRKDNLRESRQLKMDADVILMLDYENTAFTHGPRILIVDKNKNGPLAEMRLSFDPIHMRFIPIDRKGKEKPLMEPPSGQVVFEDLPGGSEDLPFKTGG